KRKQYDRFGRVGVRAGDTPGGARTWSAGAGGVPPEFGDLFEQFFSPRGGPFGGGTAAPPRGTRGQDLRHELTVSFMTAATGGAEELRLGGGPDRISVKIPAGIDTGAKLRVKGRGRPGQAGGPAGDLIVGIKVGRHPIFRREGLDVLVDVPITLAEAGLGTTVVVPLLKGSVQIKVPPGASSGRKLRVPGKGIVSADGQQGDFYAVVQVVAPDELTPKSRQLLEELSAELKNPRNTGPWTDLG
ncbi:MAG: DnaJ C-terminal domain-containing protein, partial [Planctomycetota bacterium]